MEIKQLQFMIAAVESGSFKKAAQDLYTTQPHVSKTIKSLEAELNTVLFVRHPNGVELTKTGRKIYEKAVAIVGAVKELEQLAAGGEA